MSEDFSLKSSFRGYPNIHDGHSDIIGWHQDKAQWFGLFQLAEQQDTLFDPLLHIIVKNSQCEVIVLCAANIGWPIGYRLAQTMRLAPVCHQLTLHSKVGSRGPKRGPS